MDALDEKRLWVSTWLCGHSPFLGVSVRIWTWGALVRGIAHPQVTMAVHSHHSGLIYAPPLFMPNSVSGTCETQYEDMVLVQEEPMAWWAACYAIPRGCREEESQGQSRPTCPQAMVRQEETNWSIERTKPLPPPPPSSTGKIRKKRSLMGLH